MSILLVYFRRKIRIFQRIWPGIRLFDRPQNQIIFQLPGTLHQVTKERQNYHNHRPSDLGRKKKQFVSSDHQGGWQLQAFLMWFDNPEFVGQKSP